MITSVKNILVTTWATGGEPGIIERIYDDVYVSAEVPSSDLTTQQYLASLEYENLEMDKFNYLEEHLEDALCAAPLDVLLRKDGTR